MQRGWLIIFALTSLGLLKNSLHPQGRSESAVIINEFVVDAIVDRTHDGKTTGSDEYVEIFNNSFIDTYFLKGWKLESIDTTPTISILKDIVLLPREFYTIQNPLGEQNNNGEIKLFDASGTLVDRVVYGNWDDGSGILSGIPSGKSSDLSNESCSRYPDGSETWVKTYSTPGIPNVKTGDNRPEFQEYSSKNGMFNIKAANPNNKSVVLQYSSDLKNWLDLANNSSLEDYVFFDIPHLDNQGFYRLVEKR